MMPIPVIKLSRWHRRVVVWTAILLSASGAIWMAAHYALEFAPNYDGSDARSLLHAVLQTHGVVAYGAAIVFGSLLGRHVPSALRGRPWRMSGVFLLLIAAGLIVSALLLYYAAGDSVREIASLTHQALGAIATILAASHFGRRAKASATPAP